MQAKLDHKGSTESLFDTGASHIEFRVGSIEASKAKLEAKGIKFNDEPIRISYGPFEEKLFLKT